MKRQQRKDKALITQCVLNNRIFFLTGILDQNLFKWKERPQLKNPDYRSITCLSQLNVGSLADGWLQSLHIYGMCSCVQWEKGWQRWYQGWSRWSSLLCLHRQTLTGCNAKMGWKAEGMWKLQVVISEDGLLVQWPSQVDSFEKRLIYTERCICRSEAGVINDIRDSVALTASVQISGHKPA